MNTVTLLRSALGVLKEGGWIKGSYRDGGMHCAVGAVEQVMDDNANEYGDWGEDGIVLYDKAVLLLNSVAKDRGMPSAVSFNDAPETKFEDVRSLFMAAIKRAKEA